VVGCADLPVFGGAERACRARQGAALLVVLLIVMAVTVVSLGFVSRSDVELACGSNMALRTKNDYLAESGLEHAKGLILNPQDLDSEYWTGAVSQQLVDGSADYYDVQVLKLAECNYQITCDAYHQSNGEQIGLSSLQAELRLDPSIAFWTENDATICPRVTIAGDVYCSSVLTNNGAVNGDAFVGALNGTVQGRQKALADISLQWPQATLADFTSHYSVQPIAADLSDATFGPYSPVRVCYRGLGDVVLAGNVQVNGMLAVDGSLTVRESGNVVRAAKNLPALLVRGNLIIENGCALDIRGLALVEGQVQISAGVADVNVTGALFTKGGVVETTADSSGNDNIGLIYNSPTWRPSGGQVAGALEFDGVDDYLCTPDDSSRLQLSGDYTLAVWVKPDPTQQDWAAVFSKRSPDGSAGHWAIRFDDAGPKNLVVRHTTSSWNTGITLGDIAGAWHHLRVVREGEVMTAYLDGAQVRSDTWNESPGSGDGHLDIGADRTDSSAYSYSGLIDDLCVYDCAPDVNQVYPQVDPIGHWKLDEQTGGAITIVAAPAKAAIVLWPAGGAENWTPAGGAFFRSIKRN
jgi:hypothetical protein